MQTNARARKASCVSLWDHVRVYDRDRRMDIYVHNQALSCLRMATLEIRHSGCLLLVGKGKVAIIYRYYAKKVSVDKCR